MRRQQHWQCQQQHEMQRHLCRPALLASLPADLSASLADPSARRIASPRGLPLTAAAALPPPPSLPPGPHQPARAGRPAGRGRPGSHPGGAPARRGAGRGQCRQQGRGGAAAGGADARLLGCVLRWRAGACVCTLEGGACALQVCWARGAVLGEGVCVCGEEDVLRQVLGRGAATHHRHPLVHAPSGCSPAFARHVCDLFVCV